MTCMLDRRRFLASAAATSAGLAGVAALPRWARAVSADAEPVFSMDDPVGDDVGDGDYTYPSHKGFKKGVLDLTGLQVFRDDRNA